jgi:NADPH-dependent 2,4-dienoyl-CoA reductase/sulfur reductase-like enzyme
MAESRENNVKFVIIGGSDAGISAALRARELDKSASIIVALADGYPNFSICGLPFFLSGETPDWHRLAHRTEFEGIELLLWHEAVAIDPAARTVVVAARDDGRKLLSYDQLLIATGAVPLIPHIPGMNLPGVHSLHTMDDAFAVYGQLHDRAPRSAIIVGAGYIGVEMADALVHRNLEVTLLGKATSVLATLDPELGNLIGDELRRHGIVVKTDVEATGIESMDCLRVFGTNGFAQSTDLVLVAAGVRPASDLALKAGISMGQKAAIRVDSSMRTSIPDIYAAGDCAETWHRMLKTYSYLPLGTTSHKQGRIAGENAVGGVRHFAGSVGTQVVKVFDLAAARTGLRDHEAIAAGFNPLTFEITAWDHKEYYPGARELRVRVTGDLDNGKLLGAQIVGHWRAEVAKRIDIFAAALFHGMSVEDLNDLDLSYTPPLSSPWDPVQLAAQAWCRKASRP